MASPSRAASGGRRLVQRESLQGTGLGAGGRKPAMGSQRKGGEERLGKAARNPLALVSALGWWGGWGASGLGQRSWGQARCHPTPGCAFLGYWETGSPNCLGLADFPTAPPGIPVLLLLLGFPVFVGVRTLKIRVRVQGPQAGVGSCELGAVKGAALLQATSPGAHREPG